MRVNKILSIIVFISFFMICVLLYFNYGMKSIRVKEIKDEEIEVFADYKDSGIDVCYGSKLKCEKINYKTQGTVNTKKLGTYTLTYRISHDGNEKVVRKKVKVVDKTAPKLEITGVHDNVCPNGKTRGISYHATDNYDGDITDKIKYKIKDDKIIYKVKDSSGNETVKEFKVKINDSEKPSIILNDEPVIYLGTGSNYEEPGYVALDNCDGDITSKVKISSNLNTNKEGDYTINYVVTDSYGNSTSVSRLVKVFKKNSYVPGETSSKMIYLTFDDGPGPYTAKLLDILNKYNVKATFFVTGYDDRYNDLITREHNEGHTVGLHSYTHNYASIYVSIDAYMKDLLSLQEKVSNLTGGYKATIIRFPGGSSNTISRRYKVGIMSELTKKVEEIGFRYFDWTIASGDTGGTKDTNKIVENVTTALKENRNNVVLMHDIKGYSVDAVEKIIQYGLANGYTFAPITMQSPIIHQHVNN